MLLQYLTRNSNFLFSQIRFKLVFRRTHLAKAKCDRQTDGQRTQKMIPMWYFALLAPQTRVVRKTT